MRNIALSQEQEIKFNELMGDSYTKVFNLAYRLSNNRADAEDLTQEAFYRAYRAFDQYQGDRPFENWIFRIVTRLFLDLTRSRKRRVRTVSYDAPLRTDLSSDTVQFETADDSPGPEGVMMHGAVSEDLEASMNKLSDDQQLLVWLADVEGVPYKDLAELMNTPVGTIRSRLHRAHKQLRQALESVRAEKNLAASPQG
ncbi:MAG: RNA polymerase sigma factor [Fimbriimonadaceae bacterium]